MYFSEEYDYIFDDLYILNTPGIIIAPNRETKLLFDDFYFDESDFNYYL